MKFFAFKKPNQSAESFQFKLEDLEPRMMLSTVQIFAAGAEGGEQLQLQIAGNVAETGGIARINLSSNGTVESEESIQGLENITLPLDVTVGPDGSVFVAEFGTGAVRAFVPTS